MVQEALLRVWQAAARFVSDGRPDGLLRLAIRIARNLAVSELRGRRIDPVEIEALEHEAERYEFMLPPPPPADPFLRRTIEACRKALPPQPRAAFDARLESLGEPDDEPARRLGMKVNTFLQNLSRARRFMAECLRRRGVALAEELS